MPAVTNRPLLGHTAVIAHGGSGIGLQAARHLAAAGADVILLDEDPEVGATASRLRSDLGMPAMGARGDLADPGFVSTAFRAAVEHLDFPDLLVLAGPQGAAVVIEAFRARLAAAGKPGVCIALVAGLPEPDRADGEITHVELGLAEPALLDAIVGRWQRVRLAGPG